MNGHHFLLNYQNFHVAPEVRVTIVKIDRNLIRIGIEAGDDVSVLCEEIVFEIPQDRALGLGAARKKEKIGFASLRPGGSQPRMVDTVGP